MSERLARDEKPTKSEAQSRQEDNSDSTFEWIFFFCLWITFGLITFFGCSVQFEMGIIASIALGFVGGFVGAVVTRIMIALNIHA